MNEVDPILRAAADGVPDPAVVLDPEGKILHANRAFGALLELRPRQLSELIAAAPIAAERVRVLTPAGADQLFARALQVGRPLRADEVEAEVGPGRRRTLIISAAPIPTAGGPRVLVSYRDVSAEARVQASFREMLAAERSRADALAEANRAKDQFLANMSHELRTPLNAILGYTEMLLEDAAAGPLPATAPQDLEKIVTAGQHLLQLINSVLDLSKIEAGSMTLEPERFDLAECLDGTLDTVRPLAERGNNQLISSYPPGLGEVRTDKMRLRQVLLNLLSNACKFTQGGQITLGAEARDGGVAIQVRDTGIGIAPADRERLFQPFFQADASTTRRFGGTGLGLAISRRFATMMGGEITVESEPGQGTTFHLTLPRDCPVEPLATAPKIAPPITASPARTVLCIDDDPVVLEILMRTLRREGYDVAAALEVNEGVALARRLRPAVITLDVMMPGTDGWAALQTLQGDPELASIPVVMLTILSERQLAFSLGAAEYITKPVDREQLTRTIRRFAAPDGAPILVVEDDAASAEILSRSIQRAGLATLVASDGRQAIEVLERIRPAAVLLDLMMPGMDGFEVVARMRAHPVWAEIPVVIVTARDLSRADLERLSGQVETILSKHAQPLEAVAKEVLSYAERARR